MSPDDFDESLHSAFVAVRGELRKSRYNMPLANRFIECEIQ